MPSQISIVMPSYQQGSYLTQAIRSVLDQEFTHLELWVQDAGSVDETLPILKGISQTDSRLHWSSEPDQGQAHAVNKGFRRTTAPIIGWLNSDDVLYPGALGAVIRYFNQNPEVDVVYGEGDHIDPQGRFLERHPTEAWDPARLTESVIMAQPSVFFRRSVVERWGGLNESLHYCMDYEYWIRLSQKGASFLYIPWVLSGTRMHDGAKTLRHRQAMHAEINDMLRRHLGQVPERWLLNYACVVAGIDRRPSIGTLFRTAAVLPIALWAAWNWNRRVRPESLVVFSQGMREKAVRAWQRRKAA